jgi:hypothetical protein
MEILATVAGDCRIIPNCYILGLMKVVVLYRPNSEHSRKVEEFVRDFTHSNADRRIELVSLDTRDGASTATLYDVMQYPAVLALGNDGSVLREWEGEMLPLMNEVAYYASA